MELSDKCTTKQSPQRTAICSLGTQFYQHKLISTFRELEHFTGIKTLPANFLGQSSIEYVILPANLITLNQVGLSYTLLRDLVIPESVTSIGVDFIRGCTNLERVVIYGKVTNLANRMFFDDNRLKLLVLPETVTTLANSDQFLRTYSLATVICNAPSPPTLANTGLFVYLGSNANFPIDHEQVIYVPNDSIGDYSTAQYWSSYASRLRTFSQLAVDNPEYYERYVVNRD